MYNPFIEITDDTETDAGIIQDILEGNTVSLEKLVYRHQAWIFNIALKMVFDPDDAEDVTQEILLKIITHLSSYNPEKGTFRAWLYRIAANHVLNMKTRKREIPMSGRELAESYPMSEENIEDTRLSGRPEYRVLVEEAKNMCLTGILLCLERKQRLAFILGELFSISSSMGAEIMEITDAGFRTHLSRARKKVENFVAHRCGLLNPENPCRCAGHIKNLISSGWVDSSDPRLTRESLKKISSIAVEKVTMVNDEIHSALQLFRDQPFYNGPDMVARMKELIGKHELSDLPELQ